jgi:zinc D-Ala-D-Ala carboxypeptidase
VPRYDLMCFRVHSAVSITALTALLWLGLFQSRTIRAQSQANSQAAGEASKESRVKPTALIRDRRVETVNPASSVPAPFSAAATSNAQFRTELNWTFGGKQQRGWYLYTPLIGRLLNTDDDVASDGFASALARWQEKSGLPPSGVLDDQSLYSMISVWQDRRIKDRSPAEAHQLVIAPASDFYHPERLEELRQVERETYAAYKRMVAAAVADPLLGLRSDANGALAATEKYLKIISAFRTREYQEKLRRESPHVGRAGLAINSPHFTGRALDIYVGGEPAETNDSNRAVQVQTRVYQWLVRNAERFGFRPYYYEPWHWEYVGR